jgi:hypothetical protein
LHQTVHQSSKQTASDPTAGPAVTVQYPVVVSKSAHATRQQRCCGLGEGTLNNQHQNIIPCGRGNPL